jgi:hypothetical protein
MRSVPTLPLLRKLGCAVFRIERLRMHDKTNRALGPPLSAAPLGVVEPA